MRPGSARVHGADIYDAAGRPRRLLDFSSTVVNQAPPAAWRTQARRALERLLAYPQPRSQGLAAWLERRLGLPEASVLPASGSLECLDWLARAAAGRRVLLEVPCFGEYQRLLQSAGARLLLSAASSPTGRRSMDARCLRPLERGDWVWIANPSNPSGLCLAPAILRELLEAARRMGVNVVVDEALAAQRLDGSAWDLAPLAVSTPGLFVVRSLSKGLGLPGLRLGYLAARPASLARLLPFTRPWNVHALAQALGAWAFDAERHALPGRRRRLAAAKADLLRRLRPLRRFGLESLDSDTGYFLLRLPRRGPDAIQVEAQLETQGLLVRPCHTYGPWGRRFLRLNPRSPRDNARLVRALVGLYGR